MTLVLAAPLLPATLAVVVGAFALDANAVAGVVLSSALAAVLSVLAAASVDRRRAAWGIAAIAVALVAAHGVLPYAVPPIALAFDVPRAVLARPIELLIPAPDSAVLLGIVLGERDAIPAGLTRAFATTGTTHLLAISGFNMTLVATAVALGLRGRTGPAARATAAVIAVVGYSLLVGLSPSVLRAALMAAVAAFGVITGRRAATANALCGAVAAMIAVDPHAVNDVGLQLSALATAGLVLWQAPLATRLAWLPAPVREGVATTVAATAPTLPVVAGVFGRVSLVSLAANLVCVPLFPVLMLAGAATSVAGAASLDAARPVALVAWGAAAALRVAVETFASLPLAAIAIPAGPLTGLVVAVAEIVAVRGFGAVRRATIRAVASYAGALQAMASRRWRIVNGRGTGAARRGPLRHGAVPPPTRRTALALALVLVAAPAALAAAWPASPAVRVVALDIGQGDAYLVEVGGARALIDGGPDGARVLEELGAMLPPWERRIDIVAMTHAHTDHGAGLLSVLERYEVGLALEPEGLNPGPLADLWTAAIAKNGAQRLAVRAGQRILLGDATLTVLAPDVDLRVDVPSLILRLERGPFSVLFSGDAVDDALARVLQQPAALRSRVYVPPHHGAATPYALAMREAVHPDAALISVGAGNRYGHPTPQTLAALRGVPTYRTDQDGTVEIALDGTGLVVRTHANALPPPRRGPLPYTPSGG